MYTLKKIGRAIAGGTAAQVLETAVYEISLLYY